MIIDGRSICGKTKLLIKLFKELRETTNKEIFDKIKTICPTFKKNKTYQNEEFLFDDNNILLCDCDFDDVEQWIKISGNYLRGSYTKNIFFFYSQIY